MEDLIKQGAAAFKAGDLDTARKLLTDAIKLHPDDERAWGWMYNVCTTDQDRILCLKNMIRINPENEKATKLLNELEIPEPPLELPVSDQLKNPRAKTPPQEIKQPKQASVPKSFIADHSPKFDHVSESKKNKLVIIGVAVLAFILMLVAGIFIPGLIKAQVLATNTPIPTKFPPTLQLPKTPAPTPTRQPTYTPAPTSTALPSATPIYGTFANKLKIGDTAELPVIPEAFIKLGVPGMGLMEFTFQDVKFGNEALEIAKNSKDYFTDPISGQEYIAIQGHMKFDNPDDRNKLESIYPDWSLTLRYDDEGDDVYSTNTTDVIAEGYPPIEGDFWLFFLIKAGSSPSLYFQPNLIITEQRGYRTWGVYFDIIRTP